MKSEFRITKRSVEALPFDGKWRSDSEVPGFVVRAMGGRRVYWFKYGAGVRGRSRWILIGAHGEPWLPDEHGPTTLTAERAREEALQLRGLVLAGKDPASARDAARAVPTLGVFFERYDRDHITPHKGDKTGIENRRNFANDFGPLRTWKLDQIDTAMVTRWHLDMKHKPIHANRCLGLLSHVLTMARTWGVLPADHVNPCGGVKRFKETSRRRFLSEQELVRVGEALAKRETLTAKALRLLLFTGARLGELCALKRGAIDAERMVAIIRRKGREMPLYFPAPAREVMAGLPIVGEYVLPNRRGDGHIRPAAVQRAWYDIRKEAGLEDVHLHDLRHSFASVAVAGGSTLPIIGALLGHTQPSTTTRYAHLSADPLLAAAEAASSKISAALDRGARRAS